MGWLVFFGGLSVLGVLGFWVNVNALRFEARVAAEVRQLEAAEPAPGPLSAPLALPAPVARYRQLAVGNHAAVHRLRLHHQGTFRLSPNGKAWPIEGRQSLTADPPGFHWVGRIRFAPGLWVDARDMSVDGLGSMHVQMDDTFNLVQASGGPIDEGAALRLLAELVWLPTALFDPRHVRWEAVDERHAKATLSVGGQKVQGLFEFGPDGLPTQMSAPRMNDQGQRLPWGGVYRDWRSVSGMQVPFEAEVSWQLDSGPFSYAHWLLDDLIFEDGPKR